MQYPIRRILVGAAAPDGSDPVLVPAAALARRLGAALHVAHAFELPAPVQSAYAREALLDRGAIERYRQELRAGLEARVRERVPDLPLVVHVEEGPPSERICVLVREVDADLVVVGASRRGRVRRQLLGTTAEGVARECAVPVLVLRQSLPAKLRRVLLATDLSALSGAVHERGLDVVETLFPEQGPELRSLLVVADEGLPFALSREALERLAQRELDHFVRALRPRWRAMQGRVRLGNPADEILSEAAEWQADLVLMGSHGRPKGQGHLLGRVAGAVLRGAPGNVLVLPPGEAVPPAAGAAPFVTVAAAPAPSG